MRFELFGRVQIRKATASEPMYFSAPKVEIVLLTLMANVGKVVSVQRLTTEIWQQDPPIRANATVHVYISQLRKRLRALDPAAEPIVTVQPGYQLRVPADRTDLHDFREEVRRGREYAAAQQHDKAIPLLRSALRRSRGTGKPPYVQGPVLTSLYTWLDETRLDCKETLADSMMTMGQHRELTGPLQRLVCQHPLHEAFYRQLMLAYFRSGRRADALLAYQVLRSRLQHDLGLDPSSAAQELHRSILDGDEALHDVLTIVKRERTSGF
ncbi:BTAD domain-containing putative transcriptional regulator [Nocardia sp. NPDC052566]|uniref:AfsR/SARP family transcriptional regulator n=1 Tax=Nocardia sp. NPDC052566 TaxID=3364330 RepID=UPI0037CAD8CB